jgi:hypothetical protein
LNIKLLLRLKEVYLYPLLTNPALDIATIINEATPLPLLNKKQKKSCIRNSETLKRGDVSYKAKLLA